MWRVASVSIAALLLVACESIDTKKMEQQIKDESNKQLVVRGVQITSVGCVSEGEDKYHYACLAKVNNNTTILFKVTCQADGQCLWQEVR